MSPCCSKLCAKVILVIYNFLLFFFGLGLLGIGIFGIFGNVKTLMAFSKLAVGQQSIIPTAAVEVSLSTPSFLPIGSYVLIAIGAFYVLMSLCGLLGAANEIKSLLGIYLFLLVVILLVELACTIFIGIMKAKVELEAKNYLVSSLNTSYVGLPASVSIKDTKMKLVTMAWDSVQTLYKCCGINGATDFIDNANTMASLWTSSYRKYNFSNNLFQGKGVFIPPACCKMKFDDVDFNAEDKMIYFSTFMINEGCPVANGNSNANGPVDFNANGCYNAITEGYIYFSIIFVSVVSGLVGLEILAIVFTCCIMRSTEERQKFYFER